MFSGGEGSVHTTMEDIRRSRKQKSHAAINQESRFPSMSEVCPSAVYEW
jgi:hypothetical protein